jgi:hypothetical protein
VSARGPSEGSRVFGWDSKLDKLGRAGGFDFECQPYQRLLSPPEMTTLVVDDGEDEDEGDGSLNELSSRDW